MVAWLMLRAILADLHVGQGAGDAERFTAALDELDARGVDEVIFLGDVFRTLIGYPKFWDRPVEAGLTRIAALRRRGARVVMVEGNRDFFLDSPAMDDFRDLSGSVHSFSAGGRRFLLEHGDLVNSRDRAYRFWRAVSKSRVARAWARTLPASVARRIVARTERKLAATNFSYRRALPESDLARQARQHFAAGVDTVLWGHFHKPWSLREGRHEAHVVPAWGEFGTIVTIHDDGELRGLGGSTFR